MGNPELFNQRALLFGCRGMIGSALGKLIPAGMLESFSHQDRSHISAFSKMDYASIGLSGQLVLENPEPAIAAD